MIPYNGLAHLSTKFQTNFISKRVFSFSYIYTLMIIIFVNNDSV